MQNCARNFYPDCYRVKKVHVIVSELLVAGWQHKFAWLKRKIKPQWAWLQMQRHWHSVLDHFTSSVNVITVPIESCGSGKIRRIHRILLHLTAQFNIENDRPFQKYSSWDLYFQVYECRPKQRKVKFATHMSHLLSPQICLIFI